MDRNLYCELQCYGVTVALRKESVDRNIDREHIQQVVAYVALRKESVDRNDLGKTFHAFPLSLSARRAWIEMTQCKL